MDFKKLTEYLESLEDAYGIPACDCKIMKDHREIYRHLTGWADYGKHVPLGKDTVYRLFSATKLVTMTAVLQQIERGNLRLYDNLAEYLPEYEVMKVVNDYEPEIFRRWPTSGDPCHYAHRPIRIIDLMTMTAGMSYDTGAEELRELKKTSGNRASTREVVRAMSKLPLLYDPGARYCYSLAHDVLAAVVELAAGKIYSEYLRENIFEPLGMNDLRFSWDEDPGYLSRVCALYKGVAGKEEIIPDGGGTTDRFRITKCYESGGAGLAGTVDDYTLLPDALSCGGAGIRGERILKEETVRMLNVSYTTGRMSRDFAAPGREGYEYGLGVRVRTAPGRYGCPVGEFGWDSAAGAYVLVDPVHHVSLFYSQHVLDFPQAYSEIHPRVRDLAYEGMRLE